MWMQPRYTDGFGETNFAEEKSGSYKTEAVNPKLNNKNMSKKHQMSTKFKQLVAEKKQFNCEELQAMYMNYKKPTKPKVWGGGPGQQNKTVTKTPRT